MENNNSVFSDDGDPEIQELVDEFGFDLFMEKHNFAGTPIVALIVVDSFDEVAPFSLLCKPGDEVETLRTYFTCECCDSMPFGL